MKTVVIYKSKTGFTRKYAEWLAQSLQADIFTLHEIDLETLTGYDNIIYGGGLYAVGINGVKFITKYLEHLSDKKIVIFATGASPVRDEVLEHVIKANIPATNLDHLRVFYLRGGFDYSKLSNLDKALMMALKFKIKMKQKLTGKLDKDELGMLSIYNKRSDFTQEKYIQSIVDFIRS